LRRANERVAEFRRKMPIAELWGSGEKASADMMALDASRHLYSARIDPRRRTYAAGISPTCWTATASSTTSPSCSANERNEAQP